MAYGSFDYYHHLGLDGLHVNRAGALSIKSTIAAALREMTTPICRDPIDEFVPPKTSTGLTLTGTLYSDIVRAPPKNNPKPKVCIFDYDSNDSI